MTKFGYETTDGHGYKLLLRNAKNNRRYATEAESVLWEYLRKEALGVRFRRQHPIDGYIPDFVCLKKRLVIEIDGGYHFIGDQPVSDAERTNYLKERGFEVIRFKNEEVLCDINKVVQQIKDKIMAIQSTETPTGTPLLRRGRGRLIIVSAPSGTGKSTIISWLMKEHPELNLAFSISCTSRAPRGTEKNGVEYFFLSPEEFRQRIDNGEFLEYEEVYEGRFYGTLKAQVERQLEAGQNVVFDVDVKGGVNIKNFYGDKALSLFIQPPSIKELRRRLEGRGTDAPEVIDQRIARAEFELTFAEKFDKVVVNDILEYAEADALAIITEFLNNDN
jgi:guanylate kinase